MDPFHVVHLAGNALDECRKRIQQELHHRRGRATDPLYKARKVLHTRSCLLTARQQHQILDLFSNDEHVALEVTWSVYQNIIDAYRAPDTSAGKALMQAISDWLIANADASAYVCLMAKEPADQLYQQFGFQAIPGNIGMRWIKP